MVNLYVRRGIEDFLKGSPQRHGQLHGPQTLTRSTNGYWAWSHWYADLAARSFALCFSGATSWVNLLTTSFPLTTAHKVSPLLIGDFTDQSRLGRTSSFGVPWIFRVVCLPYVDDGRDRASKESLCRIIKPHTRSWRRRHTVSENEEGAGSQSLTVGGHGKLMVIYAPSSRFYIPDGKSP